MRISFHSHKHSSDNWTSRVQANPGLCSTKLETRKIRLTFQFLAHLKQGLKLIRVEDSPLHHLAAYLLVALGEALTTFRRSPSLAGRTVASVLCLESVATGVGASEYKKRLQRISWRRARGCVSNTIRTYPKGTAAL